MDSLARSDIFFIITACSVVIMTILVGIAAVYIIKILKDVRYISNKAKEQTNILAEDIQDLRERVKHGSFGLAALGSFIKHFTSRRKSNSKK